MSSFPLVSNTDQKWLDIGIEIFDEPDLVFDTGVVAISWLHRLAPKLRTPGLDKVGMSLNCASDLTHLISLPKKIKKVIVAKSSWSASKELLSLVRSIASLAKFVLDIGAMYSPNGLRIARSIKYGTWLISGIMCLIEAVSAIQKEGTTTTNMLNITHRLSYLALGALHLLNQPALRPIILPVSTVLLTSVISKMAAKHFSKN